MFNILKRDDIVGHFAASMVVAIGFLAYYIILTI